MPIRIDCRLKYAVLCLVLLLSGRAEGATMNVGTAELLYTNYDLGTASDLSCPTLKKSDTEIYTWTSNGQYAFAKYYGPLNDPQRTRVWSGYGGRYDFTGFPSGYRPWLGNIHKHTDGTLIGFVHIETDVWDSPNCEYRQGIAVSTDNGDHWKYCGDVIRSSIEAAGQQNLGGCALVTVGSYFYQYFNEYRSGYYRHPSVARAPIAEVVAAAKSGTVSSWKKYYNGSWDQDGLTGMASSVLPYPSDRYDAHGDAVYCAPLGKYLMTVFEQSGWDYNTFQQSPANRGLYMYTSSDGVNWGDKRHVYCPPQVEPYGETPYSFFAGLDGASDDCNVVGSSFYLFFPDRINHRFFRIPITISDANMVLTPSISPNGGTFETSQQVALSCGTSGAEIRYTTDGSTPSSSSALYSSPFTLNSSATVKARGIKSGMTDSPVASASFTKTSSTQAPYGGSALPVPGTIEAEDYDLGGEGVAYHDLTTANQGGAYRTAEGVDVETIAGGGYNIGFAGAGEWTEYTVDVAASGTYDITLRVANAGDGGQMHVAFGGVNKTGNVTVPNTGGWTAYQDVTVTGVALSAGEQVMRISFDTASNAAGDGVANLDRVSIADQASIEDLLYRIGLERPDDGRMRVYDMQGREIGRGTVPRGIYLINTNGPLRKIYLGD